MEEIKQLDKKEVKKMTGDRILLRGIITAFYDLWQPPREQRRKNIFTKYLTAFLSNCKKVYFIHKNNNINLNPYLTNIKSVNWK